MPDDVTSPFGDKLEELGKEFAESQLESMSRDGRSFTYPKWSECVARLNRVLGPGGWSLEVIDQWRDDVYPDWYIAHVSLTVHVQPGVPHEVVRESIDAMEVAKYTENHKTKAGQPLDIGDTWKGAISNAAKKAAWHLGVGLYLSRGKAALEYDAKQADIDAKADAAAQELGWPDHTTKVARHSELLAEIRRLQERSLLDDDDAETLKSLGYGWPMSSENFDDYTQRLESIVEQNAATQDAAPQSVELGQGG